METIIEAMASLPERFNPLMAGKLRSAIQFDFTGVENGRWFMHIEEGRCLVGEGDIAVPDATITMSAEDFIGINAGTVNAVETFWSGRIEIYGSVDAVLALPPILDWR